jgi:hypothetical protein
MHVHLRQIQTHNGEPPDLSSQRTFLFDSRSSQVLLGRVQRDTLTVGVGGREDVKVVVVRWRGWPDG